MLGIIIALKSEYKIDPKGFKKKNVGGFETYSDKTSVLIYSGVGKANAAAATTILINVFGVKKIVNIGTVGSIDKNIRTFDVVIPEKICYFDVDISHFGYEKNQMAREKEFYEPTMKLGVRAKKAILRTGETFVTSRNYKSLKVNGCIVDMEGCAIALVCSKAKIPCSFLKVVSDSVFEPKKSSAQWSQNVLRISSDIASLIRKIKK